MKRIRKQERKGKHMRIIKDGIKKISVKGVENEQDQEKKNTIKST